MRAVTYGYDAQNRLESARLAGQGQEVRYRRLDDGLLAEVTYHVGGLNRTFDYDGANRVKTVTNRTGSATQQFVYEYDRNGNRARETRKQDGATVSDWRFGYDRTDRLTEIQWGGGVTLGYEYDAVGNRQREFGVRGDGTAVDVTSTYDPANRLQEIRNTADNRLVAAYQYNANGNVTGWTSGATSWTYTYDIRDQLTKATKHYLDTGIPKEAESRYDYDCEKRRIGRMNPAGEWTRMVYAGDQILTEHSQENALVNRYEYGLEIIRGETDGYYFTDGQGSVTAQVAAFGAAAQFVSYDPWGQILAGAPNATKINYTGQWRDAESGLVAMGNGERYYDLTLGRFLQEDSFAGMLGLPASLNRYSYVHNNPLKYTDPTGHLGFLATVGVGALFGFLVDFGYQTVDVYFTGQQDQYDLEELGKAALMGAAWGAGIGLGVALLGPAVGVGATIAGVGIGSYSAYINYQDQRYGYAAVDVAATFFPFLIGSGGSKNPGRGAAQTSMEGNFGGETGLAKLTSRVKGMLPEREGPGLLTSRELPEILFQRGQGRSGGGGSGGFGGLEPVYEGVGRSGSIMEGPTSSARDLNSLMANEGESGSGKGTGKSFWERVDDWYNEMFPLETPKKTLKTPDVPEPELYILGPNGEKIPPTGIAKRLYHGASEGSRGGITPITEVLEHGLPQRGTDLRLIEHQFGRNDSAFRGATKVMFDPIMKQGAARWAEEGGVVYELQDVPFWDLNQIYRDFGIRNLLKGEVEFVIPSRIPRENIHAVHYITETHNGYKSLGAIKLTPRIKGEKQ